MAAGAAAGAGDDDAAALAWLFCQHQWLLMLVSRSLTLTQLVCVRASSAAGFRFARPRCKPEARNEQAAANTLVREQANEKERVFSFLHHTRANIHTHTLTDTHTHTSEEAEI